MKKRTVKDFIALYNSEDEEKLVLIQSGTSAGKTFMDTFWTADTNALAMADAQTGQVTSGLCYLSWPLTDKEREDGEYSKQFSKGKIYRIKARSWKGDADYVARGDRDDIQEAISARICARADRVLSRGRYAVGVNVISYNYSYI